jgi:capsular exopolysaccharide synthesis family protein
MTETIARTPGEQPTGTFDPREFIRILSTQRWLIVSVTAVVLVATALFTFTALPFFRAKLRILIERDNARVVSFQEIYESGTGSDDYYQTQYKILESRAIAEAAFASLAPGDRRWFMASAQPVELFISLRRILPVQKSRLVDVTAEHPDPAAAARIVDAIVTAYVKNSQDRKSDASSTALVRLQTDAGSLQKKLIEAEKATQEFKTRNEIVSMNDRQSLTAARLERLHEELGDIERARSDAESSFRLAEQAIADASYSEDLPEVLASAVVGNCKKVLLEAQQELSQLAQNYKPLHPRMLALQSRVQAVKEQLREEVKSIYSGLKSRFDRTLHQEADVRKRLEGQKKALIELESKAIQFQILRDEAENTRRLHDTVLSRLKEVQVVTGHETTNVHRIGGPEISPNPVRPRKLLNLAAAVIGGLILACGFAFALDGLDRSIKSPLDATRILALPVLGLVPRLEGKRVERGPLDAETFDPRSDISEVFRTIRTNLTFSSAGKDMRSILVTSAGVGEGKSMVSIHLAVSLARGGKSVLLVDADMRRPRLHRAFRLGDEDGLSSLLIGSRTLAEVALPTGVENLSVLPCGLIPPNPVELIQGAAMKDVIAGILAAFDVVVFDTPPAGVVSDACVLATQVDRALLVVRSFATDRGNVKRTVGLLQDVGATVAGVVLNHADLRANRYGGYDSPYSYKLDESAAAAGR